MLNSLYKLFQAYGLQIFYRVGLPYHRCPYWTEHRLLTPNGALVG